MWIQRAKVEIALSTRTWFGTLTFKPELQSETLMRTIAEVNARAGDWHGLGASEQFSEHHRRMCPYITAWLKRVRKEAASRFRYVVVAEYHKTGLPHYHFLLHELIGEDPIRKELLQRQWAQNGFSQAKLVGEEENAARYVCKYLAKTSAARVRASKFYGHPWDMVKRPVDIANECASVNNIDPKQIPF